MGNEKDIQRLEKGLSNFHQTKWGKFCGYLWDYHRRTVLFAFDTLVYAGIVFFGVSYLQWRWNDSTLDFLLQALLLWGTVSLCEIGMGSYKNLWRSAGHREYFQLITAGGLGFLLEELLMFIFGVPRYSQILLCLFLCLWLLCMLLLRVGYREFRDYRRNRAMQAVQSIQTGKRTVIYGAGEAGTKVLAELQDNAESVYTVCAFFDEDVAKIGHKIGGVPILGDMEKLLTYVKENQITNVIVAIPSATPECQQEVLKKLAMLEHVECRKLPNILDLVDGDYSVQLQEIQIEDLLGRPPIQMDTKPLIPLLTDKVVLVTGGGGSIGSELCRQIIKYAPKQLIVVDIYENNAYDLQQELSEKYGYQLPLRVEIASVRDAARMREIFTFYRPQVVFHAAAHKHVPLMEDSPQEAIRNNIFGTLNVVRAAEFAGVERFVQISTDKAVNPTNIMGASKRMCEMILQSRKGQSNTEFVAVRFGNVLGSNGSVVPIFKRQLQKGGPLRVTHRDVVRYFMTIPEAAQLVLRAGALAKGGELFVLDMGRPVRIWDLAENMIRLAGKVPYTEVKIEEVGLRLGEKICEELLVRERERCIDGEGHIFIEEAPAITPQELAEKLCCLEEALTVGTKEALREAMHKVVPEFIEAKEYNQRVKDITETAMASIQDL